MLADFSFSSSPDLNHDHPRPVFPAGPQPQHPRPVFPAGPQPRPSTASVLCRTAITTIHAQCSVPDLNYDHPRPVFPAGRQPRPSTPSVRCRTSTTIIHAQCFYQTPTPSQKPCQIECQKLCQLECQTPCEMVSLSNMVSVVSHGYGPNARDS